MRADLRLNFKTTIRFEIASCREGKKHQLSKSEIFSQIHFSADFEEYNLVTKCEADLRFNLVRAREFAESIAMFDGGPREVCMCMCICMCLCSCVCRVFMRIHNNMTGSIAMFDGGPFVVCMYMCICICTCICICFYAHICAHVCTRIHSNTTMCIYTCVYAHICAHI